MTIKLGMPAPFADGLITSGGFLRDFAGTRTPSAAGVVPMPDPLETIAFLAGASRTLRFGTAMVIAPLHSPVVPAKRAATIDRHSGGRLLLGLGIGRQKEEYAAVGAAYSERGARLEECVGAMRALWADAPATYRGRFTSFERVHCLPRPERGAVPVVLGGNSEPAVRRAGRIGDGWFPYTIAPDECEARAEMLRASVAAAGRSADAVEITAWPGSCDRDLQYDPNWVRRFTDAGASRLVFAPDPAELAGPRGLEVLRERIAHYRETVLDKL